jgi:cytochrome c-type biogenesis protein CcmH
MRSLPALLLFLLALVAPGAAAAEAVQADDPALARRIASLSAGLRCLVCQNQTIADSNAPLALDLKQQVREKIAAGMTDQQIRTYMVERYGDFVLYSPPLKATTVLLWVGPFVLLAAGALVLVANVRRRRREQQAVAPLTQAERERARALLDETPERP